MTYRAIRRSSGETKIERSMRGGETCRHRRIGVGIAPSMDLMDSTEFIPCSLLPAPCCRSLTVLTATASCHPSSPHLLRRRPGARDGARRQAPRPGRPRNHCSFGRRAPSHLRRETETRPRATSPAVPFRHHRVSDETDGRANGRVLIASVLCRAAMQGCSSD